MRKIVRFERIGPNEPDPQTGMWAPHFRPVIGREVVELQICLRRCPICGDKKYSWRVGARRPIQDEDLYHLPLVVEVILETSPRGAFRWEEGPAFGRGLLSRDYYSRDNGRVLWMFHTPRGVGHPTVVYVPRYTAREFFPATALVVWENNFSGCLMGTPEDFPAGVPEEREHPHIGCLVYSMVRGRQPFASQGNLKIFQVSLEEAGALRLRPTNRLFNHSWGDPPNPPGEELIRKVGETRCGVSLIWGGMTVVIHSPDHPPLEIPSCEGWYLLLHPVPSWDGAD